MTFGSKIYDVQKDLSKIPRIKGFGVANMDRSELIANALQFMRDPVVQESPLEKRIGFLEKKGLSREEIDNILHQLGLRRGNGERPAGSVVVGGPSERLKEMATGKAFSWSKLMLYVALLSSAIAALGRSSLMKWLRMAVLMLKEQWRQFMGQETKAVPLTSSLSIDRVAELRGEIEELKSSLREVALTVDSAVKEEMQQLKSSMRIAYNKLEEDIDELKDDFSSYIKENQDFKGRTDSSKD